MNYETLANLPTATAVAHLVKNKNHQFAALQVFRFADFKYNAATEVKYYFESDVETIVRLF